MQGKDFSGHDLRGHSFKNQDLIKNVGEIL